MASLFSRIISGLDFWDKDENARQREQFAREEEERKRRELQAAASRPAPPRQQFMPPARGADLSPNEIPLLQKAQPAVDTRNEDQRRLEELAKANLASAQKQATQGQNWLQRNILNRGSNNRNAEIIARNRATRDFQEAYGYNRDQDVLDFSSATLKKAKENTGAGANPVVAPVLSLGRVGTGIAQGFGGLYDILTPGEGQNRLTKASNKKAEEIDKLAAEMDVNAPYKVGNVVGEIASYFGPTLLSKAGKVGTSVAKTGTKAGDLLTKAPGMGGKAGKFAAEAVEEFFDPRNIEMEARLTGRYLGQDSARGEPITPALVAENVGQSVAGSFLPPGLRRLVKKFGGNKAEEDAVIAGTAAAASEALEETRVSKVGKAVDEGEIPTSVVGETPPLEVDEVAEGVTSVNPTREADAAAVQAEAIARAAQQADEAAAAAEAAAPKPVKDATQPAPAAEAGPLPLSSPEAIVAQGKQDLQNFINNNPGASPQDVKAVEEGIAVQVENRIAELNAAASPVVTSAEAPPPVQAAVPEEANVAANANEVNPATPAAAAEVAGGPTITEEVPATPELAAEDQAVLPEGGLPITGREAENAPLVRQQLEKQLGDVAKQLESEPQTHSVFSNEELNQVAERIVATRSDAELFDMYGTGAKFNSLAEVAQANAANQKFAALARSSDPVMVENALKAIDNIIEGTARFESEAGRGLQYSQGLFDNLPAEAKASFLLRKIDSARAKTDGKLELIKDDPREKLKVQKKIIGYLRKSEDLKAELNESEGRVQEMMDRIKDKRNKITRDDVRELIDIGKDIDKQRIAIQKANGELVKYYDTLIPGGSIDSRAGDLGRTLMLTSPIGRVNDVVTTTASALHTLAQMTGESILGKLGNALARQPGKFASAIPSAGALRRGFASGMSKSGAEFGGNILAGDLEKSLRNKASGGKAQLLRAAGNGPLAKVKRFVRAGSELATDVTQGIKTAEINRLARQEAAKMGLKGDAADAWAVAREALPTSLMEQRGTALHETVNNLNENALTTLLDGISNQLVKVPYVGEQVKNLVAPFTRWAGGNAWNAVTDKNAVAQFGKLVNSFRKGDQQGVAKALSGLALNAGAGMTLGYKLAEAGILTDEDAEGYKDGGVYIKAGDRYIPATFLGFFAPSLIMGKATHDAFQREGTNPLEDILAATGSSIEKMWNAYSRSAIPGQGNPALRALETRGASADTAAVIGGRAAGTYIPAGFSDINAFLNSTGLNPTGEAAETNVTKENPETGQQVKDYQKTAAMQLLNKIPGVSQTLPRKEGVAADDVIDRLTHGSRDTATSKEKRADAEAAADRKKRGIPETDAAIEAAWQNGDYDSANEAIRAKIAKKEKDGELSKSDKADLEFQIRRNDALKKHNISYEDYEMYRTMDLEDWRDLGDKESGKYNEKLYQQLYLWDQLLMKADASAGPDGHKSPRFYVKETKGGSGGGGGGGGGNALRGPGSPIALEKASLGNLRAQSAGSPQIPKIQKIRPNQLVKKRTISVRKGR